MPRPKRFPCGSGIIATGVPLAAGGFIHRLLDQRSRDARSNRHTSEQRVEAASAKGRFEI